MLISFLHKTETGLIVTLVIVLSVNNFPPFFHFYYTTVYALAWVRSMLCNAVQWCDVMPYFIIVCYVLFITFIYVSVSVCVRACFCTYKDNPNHTPVSKRNASAM